MIVRWGLDGIGELLDEFGIGRALLMTSERFAHLHLPVAGRFTECRPHVPLDVVSKATRASSGVDGLLAVGGGSVIDTGKAVSAATALPLVAVPTTYAGAEWTPFYGMRDEVRRLKTGGSGATAVAVLYEPELTLGLPRGESVGTALNALTHCAEALYAGPCDDASRGAALIATWLEPVVAEPRDLEARTALLEGAMHAGRALAERGLFLAHAMAQALGGRYGVSHGAMNALCLAPALRFNEEAVPEAVAALAAALETEDAAGEVERLAALGAFGRLRDFGVPESELADVAAETAARPGARANPRPASPGDVEILLRSVW